jgi:hypothetical protein
VVVISQQKEQMSFFISSVHDLTVGSEIDVEINNKKTPHNNHRFFCFAVETHSPRATQHVDAKTIINALLVD